MQTNDLGIPNLIREAEAAKFLKILPCKHPSAAWCARQHGVSRQWASRLHQDFTRKFGGYLQFRGQRFRNCALALPARRGRGRRGEQGPQPGPVASV
jgi:hypothetical protein